MLTLSLSPNSRVLSGGAMVHKVATTDVSGPYTAMTVPANHAVEMAILVESVWGSGDFIEIGTVVSRVSDEAYAFVFDISASLHAWLQDTEGSPTNPLPSSAVWIGNTRRKYRVEFAEKSGVTTLDSLSGTTKTVYFGVPDSDMVFPPNNSSSVWLSKLPQKRWVNFYEDVLISFYNYTGADFTFAPKFQIYGTDGLLLATISNGLSSPIPMPFIPLLVAEFDIINFNLKNIAVGFPLNTVAKIVFQPDINGSVIYAAPITFYNDLTLREHSRELIYRNRFGVFESIICTGEFNKSKEIQRYESFSVGDYRNHDQYYGHRAQYDADSTTNFVFRTGYISKIEKEAISDMFVTNEVYFKTNSKYIPLRLLDNKFEVEDTAELLSSYEIRCATRNTEK